MHSTFGELESADLKKEVDELIELCMDFQKDLDVPLNEHRRAKAQELFKQYDLDGSGVIGSYLNNAQHC